MVIKTKPEVNISRPASVIRYVPGPTVRLFVSCESAQAMFSWSTCRRRMPAAQSYCWKRGRTMRTRKCCPKRCATAAGLGLAPLVDLEPVAVGLGDEETPMPVQPYRYRTPKVGLGLRGYVVRSIEMGRQVGDEVGHLSSPLLIGVHVQVIAGPFG